MIRNLHLLVLLAFFLLLNTGCPGNNDQVTEEAGEPVPTAQEPPAPETQEEQATSPPPANDVTTETDQPSPRDEAQEQLTQAREAVEQAEQLLLQAPAGKGSDLALSALQQDLNSARTLLKTGEEHFQEQEFQMARSQAQEASQKADAVTREVEGATRAAGR